MSNTIFDTDFLDDEKVIIYENGKIVYEGCMKDLTFEQKRKYSRFDWHILAAFEDYRAVFIG